MENQVEGKSEPFLASHEDIDINLEHIMPEKRTEDWNHIPVLEHEDYVYRIGNLALLKITDNSRIDTAKWEIKRPELKASRYQLTKKAAEYASDREEWRANPIESRQNDLAEVAVKTWPLKK
jgi:hypothetical protein